MFPILHIQYSIVDLLPWKENEVGQSGILMRAVLLDSGQVITPYVFGVWFCKLEIYMRSFYVYGLLAIGAEEQFLLLRVLDWMKRLDRPLTFWTVTWAVEHLDVPPLRNDASHPLVLSCPVALSKIRQYNPKLKCGTLILWVMSALIHISGWVRQEGEDRLCCS